MRRLLAALALVLLAALGTAQAATTFKIATTAPEGTAWMEAMRRGADEIGRRTEGRVQFAFYPGGVMGNDRSVLRKIRAGQLQGGAIGAGGLSEVYPELGVYGLPFNFRSYAEADYVRSKMDAGLLEGLKKSGFVGFGLSENGFAYLLSGHPVRRVEDLKGHKVWVPEGDAISAAAFQAVGVSPVPLPLTDVLTGLQTGLVDTVGTSPVGAIALQWHTRVKYLADLPLSYLCGGLMIERKAFEKLGPGDQAAVREVLERNTAELNRRSREDGERAMKALQKQGIEVIQPSREDVAGWTGTVGQAMDRLAGQPGQYSAEILKTLRRHVADYRAGRRGP
jgi:TRAP-type C4-dicarboxylate transport system substrate-binding protein